MSAPGKEKTMLFHDFQTRVKGMVGDLRFSIVLFGLILSLAIQPSVERAPISERKDKIYKMDTGTSKEAIERKNRSELVLKKQNVPINDFLPGIELEADSKRRTADEISYRCLALLIVAVKGEGVEQPQVNELVKEYGLDSYFTPKEKEFLNQKKPTEHQRVQFTWRYEAAWTLLWALGYVEKLERPTSICDVPKAVTVLKEGNTQKFISDSKLRPLSQILDEADLIYRYHWATRDARLKGQSAPSGLEPGVIVERHYALNWLIGYQDQEWDDISTDT
jgi:hypothetical protein